MYHIKKFFRKLIIIDSQTTYGNEMETKTFRRIYVCQRFIGVYLGDSA